MFQRALSIHAAASGADGPAVAWDPCCSSGYLLTVLAILHCSKIAAVPASDIDEDAVRIASRHLELLGRDALAARRSTCVRRPNVSTSPRLLRRGKRPSASPEGLAAGGGDVPHVARRADVFDRDALAVVTSKWTPDIVVTDVPYGEQTTWLGPRGDDGVPGMVRSLAAVLPDEAVIALAARGRKVPQGDLQPTSSFMIGTRVVGCLRPNSCAVPRPPPTAERGCLITQPD